MQIKHWLNPEKIIHGGDSEVRLTGDFAYKKWRLPLEQVRLYQQITNQCSDMQFFFNGIPVRILPILEVVKKGPWVFSVSRRIWGTNVMDLDQPLKMSLGIFFQRRVSPEISEELQVEGINILTWNAMLEEGSGIVWVTDLASDVSKVKYREAV